jgi:Tfp pilus assembly protein PilF
LQLLVVLPATAKMDWQPPPETAESDAHHRSVELNSRGLALYRKSNLDSAIYYFSKAVDVDKGNSTAWDNLGSMYGKRDNFNEAVRCYQAALSIDSTSYQFINNMGWALMNKGEYANAHGYFTKALIRRPNEAGVLFNRALCFAKLGDTSRACDDLFLACKLGYAEACHLRSSCPK